MGQTEVKCLYTIFYYFFFIFQQWRLIPYVASVFALDQFYKTLFTAHTRMQMDLMFGEKGERMVRFITLLYVIPRSKVAFFNCNLQIARR